MKKKLLIVILAAIAILLLVGCGEKPASEATLKEDIYNSSNFSLFSEQLDMEITNLEVVKRQTTTEDKVDTVWVKVTAAGDTAEGEMYYVMTYHLYNDGWLLETIADDAVDSWHFEPLEGVPDEVIASYIPEGAEILENTVDLEAASHTVTYTYEESHLYCDVTYKKQLVFNFGSGYYTSGMHDPGRWGFQNEVDVGSYEDWHDIEGTWQYTDLELVSRTDTYTWVIDDFSPEGCAFDESCTDFTEFNVSGSCKYTSDYYLRKDFITWSNENNILKGVVDSDYTGEIYYKISANVAQYSDASYVTTQVKYIRIHYDRAPTMIIASNYRTVELTKIS